MVPASAQCFALRTWSFIERPGLSGWDFSRDALEAIRRRLSRDEEARLWLVQVLLHESVPVSVISVPKLLAGTGSLSNEMQEFVAQLYHRELKNHGLPRFGL